MLRLCKGSVPIGCAQYATPRSKVAYNASPSCEKPNVQSLYTASAFSLSSIAAKRCKRAYSKVDEAKAQVAAAMAHLEKMMKYEADAEANYNIASYELAEVLAFKYCGCDENCGEDCKCHCHD